MRACPRCGRLITDMVTQFCPNCGLPLSAEPVAEPLAEQPQAPVAPYSPPAPPYSPPPYGSPTQPPYPPMAAAPPTQPPTQAPIGPMYGQGYGAPPQSGYPSAYPGAAPSAYPGGYRPGADWRPSEQKPRPPLGRIIGAVVALLVVIAIAASVYNQTHTLTGSAANLNATPLATLSTTLLSDPLTSNANGWANDNHCYFAQDGYHDAGGYICYAPIDMQTDGTESVTVKQVSGPDTYGYGLVFRCVDANNCYQFLIDSNSKWVVVKDFNGKTTRLQNFTVNVAINGGLNVSNTLSVTMKGADFTFYVNGQQVGSLHDASIGQGKWGVASSGTGVNVVFSDYLARL